MVNKMKMKKNDRVIVISGKDKGKQGPVLKVFKHKNKVLVEGVNKVKKHVKPDTVSKEGGIVSIEKPIHISNVMYYSEKENRPVRLGYKFIKGKKHRISKKSGKSVDKIVGIEKDE